MYFIIIDMFEDIDINGVDNDYNRKYDFMYAIKSTTLCTYLPIGKYHYDQLLNHNYHALSFNMCVYDHNDQYGTRISIISNLQPSSSILICTMTHE